MNTQDALISLHVKLLHSANSTAIVQVILLELEMAHERRNLSQEELEFKKFLKSRLMGMAVIQKCQAKQHSRLRWIRHGDSNARFFHIHANVRRKQNFVNAIQTTDAVDYVTARQKQGRSSIVQSDHRHSEAKKPFRNWEALGYEQIVLIYPSYSEYRPKRISL